MRIGLLKFSEHLLARQHAFLTTEARGGRPVHVSWAPAWLGNRIGRNKRSMALRIVTELHGYHPVNVVISLPKML
jgi:hypothetical protein